MLSQREIHVPELFLLINRGSINMAYYHHYYTMSSSPGRGGGASFQQSFFRMPPGPRGSSGSIRCFDCRVRSSARSIIKARQKAEMLQRRHRGAAAGTENFGGQLSTKFWDSLCEFFAPMEWVFPLQVLSGDLFLGGPEDFNN